MKEIKVGVDETPFNQNSNILYTDGLLYYGTEGDLTDKYFIRYPVTFYRGNLNKSSAPVFVQGHVKKGDFLTTSPIYGCAMKAETEAVAFAVALEPSIKSVNRGWEGMEVCLVKFL